MDERDREPQPAQSQVQTPSQNTSEKRKGEDLFKRVSESLPWLTVILGSVALIVLFVARRVAYFWTQRHQELFHYGKLFLLTVYSLVLLFEIVGWLRTHTRNKRNWKKVIGATCTALMALLTVFSATEPQVSEEEIAELRAKNADVTERPLTVSEGTQLIARGVELSKTDDLTKAQGELGLEHFPQAIMLFDKGMAPLTGALADAHFYKARALWAWAGDDLSKYEAAEEEADMSLSLRPMYSPALVIKCSCLRNLETHPNYLKDARKACEDAIQADSKNPAAYNAMGGVLTQMKEYDAAIESFDQGIRLNDHIPQLWSNRSVAVLRRAREDKQKSADEKKKEYLRALDDANRALTLAPKFRDALLNRATVYKSLNDLRSALATYEQLVTEDPNDAFAWNNLGDATEEQNDFDKSDLPAALFDFDQALRIRPSYEDALFNKGAVLNQLAKYSEAIEPLSAACKIAPDDNQARAQLAFSYGKTGKRSDALAEARQVLKTDPKNPVALETIRELQH
jgi:tetratricopeptide (TPR) repeat protein